MRGYKKILILLCIFTLVLSITSVSASDINTNDTMDIKEEPLLPTKIEQTSIDVGSGNYQNLKNAISQSNVINLLGDINCEAGNSEIIIQGRNITINGNGHTINGNDLKGIFVVLANSELTLNNLNLINGNSLLNTNKNFIDGGTVLNMGTLNVKDCTFSYNAAQQGGAIACDMKAKTTISGTNTFSNNKATIDGGAISNKGGSVMKIEGKNTFDNNLATLRSEGKGGAILNAFDGSSLYISGENTFTNNKASLDGGVVFNHQAFLDITGNNIFAYNEANGGDGKGGAINNENGTTYLSGTNTFTANTAHRGGAIDISYTSEFTISGTNVFTGNKATFQGGAIANQEAGKFTLTGTNTFSYNSATNSGGAISVYSSPIYISGDNTFTQNTAGNSGGAIHIGSDKTISITGHSYFNENKATGSGGSGGAIFTMGSSTLNVNGAVFLDNSAVYGGAIFVNENPLNANYNIFYRNTASMSGLDVEVFRSTVKSLDLNYWGSQSKPTADRIHNYAVSNIKTWVILQSIIPSEITQDEQTKLIMFAQNSGANLNGEMGNIVVSATPNFDPSSVIITKNIGSSKYTGNIGQVRVTVSGPDYADSKLVNVIAGNIKTELIGNDVLLYANENGNYVVSLKNMENKGIANQNLVITFNDKTYNKKTNSNGAVVLAIGNLEAGNYKIKTTFNGYDKYDPSTTENDIVVFSKGTNNTQLIGSNVEMYYKNGTRYAVKLTTSEGTPLANMIVKIIINGVTYKQTTSSAGKTSIGLNLNPGTYNVTSYFIGDGNYLPVFIENTIKIIPTIEGNDITKYFKNNTQYTAKFLNKDGSPLTGTQVTFNINGEMYSRKTNSEGIAKLTINLRPGEYILTAMNPINNEAYSNTVTVLSKIKSENLIKYYKNASRFVIKTLDDEGNDLSGQQITFNINGMIYDRITNNKSSASIAINLRPGTYIITTYYGENIISNTIEVLSIIDSENLVMTTSNRKPFAVTVLDDHGQAIGGEKLSFNVNGMMYNRTSNATGNAKLSINLNAGIYIITTYYNGLMQSNTITIRDS